MRLIWATVLTGVLVMARPAGATTIDFTQFTAADATLTLGDVTITGNDGALVSVVAGTGLGAGDNGTFDAFIHFMPGLAPGTEMNIDPRLQIAVAGLINNVTLQPFLHLDGPPPIEGAFFGFDLTMTAQGDPARGFGSYGGVVGVPAPFASTTIAFKDGADGKADVRPSTLTNVGISPIVMDVFKWYLIEQNFPDATFTFGYSITSLDYTPTEPTPEPATLGLLLVGSGVLLVGLRARKTSLS